MKKKIDDSKIAVIIVDHGSRREKSNNLLMQVVEEYSRNSSYLHVEGAHMDIAQPSIDHAFGVCAQKGAELVVVFPFFLMPGKHWQDDIPKLTQAASSHHGQVPYLVTAPFGNHELMHQVISDRISGCLENAASGSDGCEICRGCRECKIHEHK